MITHVFTDTKGLRGFVGLEEKVSSRYATGSSSPLWQGGRYLFKKAAQQVCCSLFPSPCGNEGGPPPWGKEAGVRILVAQERLTDSTGYLRSVPYGKAVTRIRNRQQRQLRRLRCEILIYSVFVLSQPLPSASYCMIYRCSAYRLHPCWVLGCEQRSGCTVHCNGRTGWHSLDKLGCAKAVFKPPHSARWVNSPPFSKLGFKPKGYIEFRVEVISGGYVADGS